MKCRRINSSNGMVVWFGVKDVIQDENGKNVAVFQDKDDKHANYANKAEGVANSLKQRLSVLKKELWYDYEYGMPLTDKIKDKVVIDTYIAEIILKHPDVISIEGFESKQEGHSYTCYFIVNTIYGQVELGL